jgi:alanyl-tRNA synthetase
MNAQDIRNSYLKFFEERGHAVVPRALLVPQDDPTTLFTGSGMQPLIPYLLGQPHPKGTRIVDSQTCLRAQDIEEVGDNRHTTFFEMLGNWSLGDYFKQEQLPWFFEFLTDVVGLDPHKLYVTCFIGDEQNAIPKDNEAADLWVKLFSSKGIDAKIVEVGSEANGYAKGMQGGRIFFYDAAKNWWSRSGKPTDMPVGEIGGGDSEVFYEFDFIEHDQKWGEYCHVNCDCGRYMEIGNSVFMEYVKAEKGFEKLPKQNVDFGGGMERIAAAALDSPDMFKISVLKPIVESLETLSGKTYESYTESMRVIADHLRAATFLAVDGVVPSNTAQGYVMRRMMRRAIRFAFDLGIEQDLCEKVVPVVAELYRSDYPEVANSEMHVIETMKREELLFRKTLRSGLREFSKLMTNKDVLDGPTVFMLHDTYGFPSELSLEEAYKHNIVVAETWRRDFEGLMTEQRERSRTAAAGTFKGGLADHSEIVVKYHTATHLMYRALRNILGDHVIQRGSNITAERLRFDFSHPEKMTPEQIKAVEDMVNEQITKDWPMTWREENTTAALDNGVMGAFGDRYGEVVKVYTVGDPEGEHYSREICGGPHVEHTGVLGEGGKRFKVLKEESSSAGIRRIKAALV